MICTHFVLKKTEERKHRLKAEETKQIKTKETKQVENRTNRAD